MVVHKGGCHCGNVRFEVDAPPDLELSDCNCSICSMSGYLGLTVPKSAFRLTTDNGELTDYQFNTGVAHHYFCSHCGVKSFYVPRSHPNGINVNARCLEPDTISSTTVKPFDGQNWEKNVHKLKSLED